MVEETTNFKEGALVMLYLDGFGGKTATWWRVMFIDNDETFIGRLERHHWCEYTDYKKGDDIRWAFDDVRHIYTEDEQFCYGDGVSICCCTGLCRDK